MSLFCKRDNLTTMSAFHPFLLPRLLYLISITTITARWRQRLFCGYLSGQHFMKL